MARKKKNTNNVDADDANINQRVYRIPAANPGAAPANNRNWIIIFLFLLLFSCGEVKDSFYKTLDDAKRSGDIERGWLPVILPDSSYEIYERHDIDTNAVWVRFRANKKRKFTFNIFYSLFIHPFNRTIIVKYFFCCHMNSFMECS
jgi:hypothetical protein